MKNRAIPRLRFKRFKDVWNVVNLNKVFNKIKNAYVGTVKRYYTDSKNGHFYLESNNIKNGRINKNTQLFVNDKFYNSQKKNWLHTGDIVMVQSGAVGDTAVIPKNLNNTAAHAVIVISHPNRRINSYFFNDEFQSEYFKREIYKIATGNTIVHILSSNIKKSIVKVPSLPEQQLIGKFFAKLDKLIQLQQKKISLLQKVKQGYMQKLFPCKGKSVPNIRFKGFCNKWNSVFAKKLFTKFSRKNHEELPILSSTQHHGVMYRQNINAKILTNKETLANFKEIKPTDFIIDLGSYKNGFNCSDKLGISSAAYTVFNFRPSYNKQDYTYWSVYFKTRQFIHLLRAITYGIRHGKSIKYKDFISLKLFVPNPKEQKRIGRLFKCINNYINYQQIKLNYLQRLKKAYLQKMFI